MSNSSTSQANEPTLHTVRQGVAYQEVDGALTRNYITVGGKRRYVHAEAGAEITAKDAKEGTSSKAPDAQKADESAESAAE